MIPAIFIGMILVWLTFFKQKKPLVSIKKPRFYDIKRSTLPDFNARAETQTFRFTIYKNSYFCRLAPKVLLLALSA